MTTKFKGNLTRADAVAVAGEAAVNEAESANAEPTGRVGYNGIVQDDEFSEWSASAQGVTVYYYTNNEDDEFMADGGDLSDWVVAGYEII